MSYEVRVRNWWRLNKDWPNGREPHPTPWHKARLIAKCDTEEQAQQVCRDYNDTHKPGKLSRKAEYDKQGV